ncbi:neuroligin-2-like [Lineus longissimus]|uniref:neuroligin-2-like n=1 Tax=Lineus longissimus TaxID=88925 RepID=UPI002B4CBC36
MPAIATARVHERMEPASRTFLYYFDYISSVGMSKFRPEKAAHRAEQGMLFGPFVNDSSMLPTKLTGVDAQVHFALLTYWTNFAKYGNPSGDGTTATKTRTAFPEWPEFTVDKQQYMNIAANSTSVLLTVKKDLRAKAAAFWLDYIPYLANQTCPVFSVVCPSCPPIMDQYISYLRLTVGQAHVVIIIVFAATLAFFTFVGLILLICYIKLRKELLRQK